MTQYVMLWLAMGVATGLWLRTFGASWAVFFLWGVLLWPIGLPTGIHSRYFK